MLDDRTFGVEDPGPRRGLRGWYDRERPALKAAAWFWVVFLALSFVSLFTGWASLGLTMLLQAVVGLAAGVLAAVFHHRDRPQKQRSIRMGIFAGVYLCLTTLLVILVFAIVAGLGSLGVLVPIMVPYFVALPGEFLICSLAGGLGAGLWSYFKKW
jgi:hypothetical protein